MSDYVIKDEDFSSIRKDLKVAIVTAEFNEDYTSRLEKINVDFLKNQWVEDITIFNVPGALEIPAMAKRIAEELEPDLVLCFGVVVRGDTTHYDLVTWESARGLMDLSLEYFDTSFINGVLTCEDFDQVEARIRPVYAISGLKLIKECQKLN